MKRGKQRVDMAQSAKIREANQRINSLQMQVKGLRSSKRGGRGSASKSRRGRSAKYTGSLYGRMLANPASGPLAQYPDGYGSRTVVVRALYDSILSTCASSATQGPLRGEPGGFGHLVRPWNIGNTVYQGLNPGVYAGDTVGPIIMSDVSIGDVSSNWAASTGGATSDGGGRLNSAATYTSQAAFLTNVQAYRFLCAQVDLEYIGPHGDGQTGTVFVNQTPVGNRSNDSNDNSLFPQTYNWDTATGAGNATTFWSPTEVMASPLTKAFPVGTNITFKMYPTSVVGDGFAPFARHDAAAPLTTAALGQSIVNSLPNAIILCRGGPDGTSLYRMRISANFEIIPSDTFSAFEPGSYPMIDPIGAQKTLASVSQRSAATSSSYSIPYVGEATALLGLLSAGVIGAARTYREVRRAAAT